MLLLHIGRFSVVAAASAAEAAARFSCQPHHTNWKIIPCLDPYIDWEPIYVYQTLLIIYIRFWIYLDFVWFHCIYLVFRLSSLNRIIPIPNKWIICSYKSYNFSCVCVCPNGNEKLTSFLFAAPWFADEQKRVEKINTCFKQSMWTRTRFIPHFSIDNRFFPI